MFITLPGVSNLQPVGCMWSRMAENVAQHKIINLLKPLWGFFGDYVSQCIQCVAQDNSSSPSVAQRCQKVGHPCLGLLRSWVSQ